MQVQFLCCPCDLHIGTSECEDGGRQVRMSRGHLPSLLEQAGQSAGLAQHAGIWPDVLEKDQPLCLAFLGGNFEGQLRVAQRLGRALEPTAPQLTPK